MVFDPPTRNRLQKFVSESRALLSEEFTRQLQTDYGMDPMSGTITDLHSLTHLDDTKYETARLLRDTLEHYKSGSPSSSDKDLLDRIVREQAFTILNRFCALRMAEARGVLFESIANGYHSKGFQLYSRLAGTSLGETGEAYRCYLFSIFDEFAVDLAVLFDRYSPMGRLFPKESVLLELLEKINNPEIAQFWAEDETIGWIYQYFNSVEERREMRTAGAPRNSRELAVRNQFFTPRYVVEFLTDNTLGRIWYEMTQGKTELKNQCQYLVRRPNEIFLEDEETRPTQAISSDDVSQEELLKEPVYIPYRPLKDPREIRMLDPACGSMHFGLYAFDLFQKIYEEAWDLEERKGLNHFQRSADFESLHETYVNKEDLQKNIPRLIIENNIHGIDIDPRAVQIAGLSLWLRAQRAWKAQGLKPEKRPKILRSNIVCAEPMPGEVEMLQEFAASNLKHPILRHILEEIFEKMKMAGEAGSLLKIEDEITTIIENARKEWKDLPKDEQTQLLPEFDLSKNGGGNQKYAGIKSEKFWDTAEEKILKALKDYSEHAETKNASKKRLFAEDAAKGFTFIDLCRKRFDVILMNPPFGASTKNSKKYIEKKFPRTKGELLANFIEVALIFLNINGIIGAISSRTPFFLGSSDEFRKFVLGKESHVNLFVDLGDGVLDATVETAMYILSDREPQQKNSLFFRLLTTKEKSHLLMQDISNLQHLQKSDTVFILDVDDFSRLDGSPYAYWISTGTIKKLGQFPKLVPEFAEVHQGLITSDDYRFLRLLWEIPPELLIPKPREQTSIKKSIRDRCIEESFQNGNWIPFSKTDAASPWFSPITLAVLWKNNGKEIKNFCDTNGKIRSRPQSEDSYFLSGIGYMLRSTRIVPFVVPSGVIPPGGRSQIFPKDETLYLTVGICASNIGSAVARFNGEKFAWPKFQVGMIEKLPICELSSSTLTKVKNYIDSEINKKRKIIQGFEPFQEFCYPSWHNILHESTDWNLLSLLGTELEKEIALSYGLNEEQLSELERDIIEAASLRKNSDLLNPKKENEIDDYRKDEASILVEMIKQTPQENAIGLLSYCVGCTLGRWDIRLSLNKTLVPQLPDPLDPLPTCPPGMLIGVDGLPARSGGIVSEEWLKSRQNTNHLPNVSIKKMTITDNDYPINICWSGILVYDESHPRDIINSSRQVLEILYKDKYGDIEQEACEILGIDSLNQYFKKPTGFFADHLKRYTKSRRQAPIYWPISTSSGDYTLWLYYHRLTDQTLYSCVNDFVEPKFKQITALAYNLRNKINRTEKEEKELETLVNQELELKDFRDELLRIAQFWKPNLNDGVVITASPLWKLFKLPKWQETLKKTWENLEQGEYDWAHLAYSIWPNRIREKCKTDKSLAITHNLEELYIEPSEPSKAPKKAKRKKNEQLEEFK